MLNMKKKNPITFLLNPLILALRNYTIQTRFLASLKALHAKLTKAIFVSCIIGVLLWVSTPPALALTQIRLFDISYKECPDELAKGAVTSSGTMSASCYLVSGKAENATNKFVYDADIFGRIYDANNDSVMQNRTRIGLIPEVPPGISDFEFRISVPANQPTPLKLKQLKAAGFSAQVRK
jgi:hypothetical protein